MTPEAEARTLASQGTFQDRLRRGLIPEMALEAYLISFGYSVWSMHRFKPQHAPKIHLRNDAYNSPDMIAFKNEGCRNVVERRHIWTGELIWGEAKGRKRASWNRGQYEIGIEDDAYQNYCRLEKSHNFEVLLATLIVLDQPIESEMRYNPDLPAPTGLYGQWLSILMNDEKQRLAPAVATIPAQIYLPISSYRLMASLDELRRWNVPVDEYAQFESDGSHRADTH